MKEQKRDLEADLKILTAIPRNPNEPVNMVHGVVAPHALRRAIEAEHQLTNISEWIRSEMEAMGTPPAFSYQVGIYHGMEKVLKKIESGEVDTAIEV